MCSFWAATASWHVCITLTRVKYVCGCRRQSVDHSDEQPAGQNHRDRLQQGETDGLTGELQRLHGPGKNYNNQGLNAAYLGQSCLLLFTAYMLKILLNLINKHAIAMCSAQIFFFLNTFLSTCGAIWERFVQNISTFAHLFKSFTNAYRKLLIIAEKFQQTTICSLVYGIRQSGADPVWERAANCIGFSVDPTDRRTTAKQLTGLKNTFQGADLFQSHFPSLGCSGEYFQWNTG